MQGIIAALLRLDLLFESIAGVMAIAISHYANKAFKITGQKRLSDLSTGFLVLATAMFGRVIGTWYFFVLGGPLTLLGIVIIAYGVMKIMAYLLFLVSTRPTRSSSENNLATLLFALPVLVDPNLDFVAIIVLLMVVIQATLNYISVRTRYALYVLLGFFMLLLSHIVAIPSQESAGGYFLSQIFQFLGLTAFLVMLVKAGHE